MSDNQYSYSLDIFEKETKRFVSSFFYEKKKRKIRWIVAILLVPLIILANSFFVRAGVSYYYSPLCLGSWAHIKNVEGEPQLSLGADASEFNSSNSALLKNAGGQIYCGKFQTNDNAQNELKSLKLKFSMTVVDEGIQQLKTEDIQKGSTLDGDNNQGAVFIIQTSSPEESTPASATESPVATPEATTIPKPMPVEVEPPPVEVQPQTTSEPEPTTTPEPPASPTESPVSILKNIFFIPTATADENTGTNDGLNLDDLVDVKYSFDGENWNYLGRINRNNWKDISFDLPIDSVDQISQLQVSLSSLPTIDTNTSIYIDSIWLEAEYQSSVISFVKDIAQTILETVTLQNLDNNLASEPPAAAPQVTKTEKTVYEFDVSNSIGDKSEGINVSIDSQTKAINVSGPCKNKYFVLSVYPDEDSYKKNPSSAIYNAAFPCKDQQFAHKLDWLPDTSISGIYYLMVGTQGQTGSWQPVGKTYKINLNKKQVAE